MYAFCLRVAVLAALTTVLVAQYSDNACIVVRDFQDIQCSGTDQFVDDVVQATHITFSTLEEAIQKCPFTPVLIEFSGTFYFNESSVFKYTGDSDITLRGISRLIGTEERQSKLVGFNYFQIAHPNVSVTMENFAMQGCNQSLKMFADDEHGCAVDRSISVSNVAFSNFSSTPLLCHKSNVHSTFFVVQNSTFTDITGTAIETEGIQRVEIRDNVFDSHTSTDSARVYTKASQESKNQIIITNNRLR